MKTVDCDAEGCCSIRRKGVTYVVKLTASCNLQSLNDPIACPPCSPVPYGGYEAGVDG